DPPRYRGTRRSDRSDRLAGAVERKAAGSDRPLAAGAAGAANRAAPDVPAHARSTSDERAIQSVIGAQEFDLSQVRTAAAAIPAAPALIARRWRSQACVGRDRQSDQRH